MFLKFPLLHLFIIIWHFAWAPRRILMQYLYTKIGDNDSDESIIQSCSTITVKNYYIITIVLCFTYKF